MRGSFIVSSTGNRPFKGIAFCDESLLTFDDPAFLGTENTLTFTIDATHLDAGDKVKGTIVVVTEYGEVENDRRLAPPFQIGTDGAKDPPLTAAVIEIIEPVARQDERVAARQPPARRPPGAGNIKIARPHRNLRYNP